MNFDEAMAKVQTEIGDNCKVTKVDIAPYGWMFHYAKDLTAYWENWIDWEDPSIIGGGPIFIDIYGEVFHVPGFPIFASKCFYRNWEVSRLEYEGASHFDSLITRELDEECDATHPVNKIFLYAFKDKATEVRLKSLANLFGYQVTYCVDGEWRDLWKSQHYALVAQRIKQMADIPPRTKEHPNATQSGIITFTLKDEKYDVAVTATIVEGCEHLNLRIEAA